MQTNQLLLQSQLVSENRCSGCKSAYRIRKQSSAFIAFSISLIAAASIVAPSVTTAYVQLTQTQRQQQQQNIYSPSPSPLSTAPITSSTSQLQATAVLPLPSYHASHAELLNNYLHSLGISIADEATHHRDNEARGWFCQPLQRRVPALSSDNSGETAMLMATDAAITTAAEEEEYQRRKAEWAAKYTSVEALRETFGRSPNGFWGDLDAATTRRLYKTLMPRALLELHCSFGAHPEDLAPLAFQARLAAKLYARERCHWTLRIAANLYDGWRQWRKYGRFNVEGMTYQQLWEKYAAVIVEEAKDHVNDLTLDDFVARISLKILERSCISNAMVDRMVFQNGAGPQIPKQLTAEDQELAEDLKQIYQTLEADVRHLLGQDTEEIKNLGIAGPTAAPKSDISVPAFVTAGVTTTDIKNAQVQEKLTQDQREKYPKNYRTLRSFVRIKRKLLQEDSHAEKKAKHWKRQTILHLFKPWHHNRHNSTVAHEYPLDGRVPM